MLLPTTDCSCIELRRLGFQQRVAELIGFRLHSRSNTMSPWFWRQGRRRPSQIWRYLRTAARLVYRRPLLSVTVIPVLPDGRIVLVCRVDNHKWSLPGGIVEWGETIEKTAEREVAEETGLRITEIRGLQGTYSSPDRDPRTHAVTISIIVSVAGRDGAVDTLEVSDVKAFPPDELPLEGMAHDHERQLRDYLAGRVVVG